MQNEPGANVEACSSLKYWKFRHVSVGDVCDTFCHTLSHFLRGIFVTLFDQRNVAHLIPDSTKNSDPFLHFFLDTCKGREC